METNIPYNVYSDFLKNKYGCKVYKLPVNLNSGCPNRENGAHGCFFCGEKGAGFESLPFDIDIAKQLDTNMKYIGKKYKAEKFIAYFQNYTNTYMPAEKFSKCIHSAVLPFIVGIDISTRPDCISDKYLEILKNIETRHSLDIGIELGLQTANYHTLKNINRGHGLAEFIDSAVRIKKFGFSLCVHVIIDLPYDSIEDVIETSKIISALNADFVKIHSLYIVKNTKFDEMYKQGELKLLSASDYVDRCVEFLRFLSPDVSVQRLIGRAPKNDTTTANFNTSWWKIKDMIIEKMFANNIIQGDKYDYLNGAALKKFND